jgi:enoyl-CoA hydratase/carnithine racemase
MSPIDAQEALSIGLVDRIAESPDDLAVEFASHYTTLSAEAVSRVKAIVNSAGSRLNLVEQEREGNRAAWSGSLSGLGKSSEEDA